jgi:hypothetical protein
MILKSKNLTRHGLRKTCANAVEGRPRHAMYDLLVYTFQR